jgi:ribose transport system permease protein
MSVTTPPEVAVAPRARPTQRRTRKNWLRDYGIVVAFALLFVVLSVTSSDFFRYDNIENILSQQSPILIAAAGGALVVIAGGFDLSVASAFALTGIVAAQVAIWTNPGLGIAAGIVAGALIGVLNGAVVAIGRISAIIATLATAFVIRGVAVVATGGTLITVSDPGFTKLGQGDVAGVPIAIIVMIVFVVAVGLLLSKTTFGRRVYAIGGSEEAARLAGIRVDLVRAATFLVSGLAAGVAGSMIASRVATGQADAAVGAEFTVLAGIVVGGISVAGGEGAVWRAVIGVLLLALIDNGFTLLGLDPIYQQIVQGAIILLAVGMDGWFRRRR